MTRSLSILYKNPIAEGPSVHAAWRFAIRLAQRHGFPEVH